MHRRFLFPLAAGVVGLLAMSPVLAADSKAPDKNSPPSKATTTTVESSGSSADSDTSADTGDPADDPSADGGGKNDSSGNNSGSDTGSGTGSDSDSGTGSGTGSGGGQRSSSVCDQPETNKGPAPQMGDAPQTHEAGEAGNVDVERLSETELRIAGATANDGWTEQVATPSGPRVTVKFTRQGQSPSLMRFAATMDQRGTMIHVRVTSCG
ncbi:MAG TPA: hypothetical protein VJS45_17080 [Acidimicrobiia bacterium]|nr:hypothetical protein [Acidimicrobiia bacterium]